MEPIVTYDVIIAGASFAGLAVAAQVRGKRVLLLDRKPVGTGQTSACGTLACTLRALGLNESIQQVHDRLVLHTPGHTFVYPVFEPFCTFDYALLCRRLLAQGDAEFRLEPARRLQGNRVETANGTYHGRFIVDASGWRAVLGSQLRPGFACRDCMNFGLETTAAYEEEGLHFWFDPQELLPLVVGWAFPAAGMGRIGVGSYRGNSRLGSDLDRFLARLGIGREEVHGGYFPHTLRDPVIGDLFLVGDAAGQCLGLTGEGIRPALYFGTQLGRLLRCVLDGEMTTEEARGTYRGLVIKHRRGYKLLSLAQWVLPRLPLPFVRGLGALVSQPEVLQRILNRYLLAFRITTA